MACPRRDVVVTASRWATCEQHERGFRDRGGLGLCLNVRNEVNARRENSFPLVPIRCRESPFEHSEITVIGTPRPQILNIPMIHPVIRCNVQPDHPRMLRPGGPVPSVGVDSVPITEAGKQSFVLSSTGRLWRLIWHSQDYLVLSPTSSVKNRYHNSRKPTRGR